MVWPWSSGPSPPTAPKDPMRDLDPSLREFLQNEQPERQRDAAGAASTITPPRQSETSAQTLPVQHEAPTANSNASVPSQSLFQDGRYAYLWKTYVSLEHVEEKAKSDQERIDDLIQGYKQRKAEIARAAVENCALESWQINECFTNGPWSEILTMCRSHTQRLDRCYTMQMRFLKALGYMSTIERTPAVDEEIQMHADKLYQRMIAQEKAIDEAKKAGAPIPKFPPILSTAKNDLAVIDTVEVANLKPEWQKAYNKRLKGLEGEERLLEEKAVQAELRANQELKTNLSTLWAEKTQSAAERAATGQASLSDKVWRFFRGQ